jgi:type I restriction enzyme, S subunit
MKSEQSEQGERRPKLRFPEFENAGGWDEKKLKDIADIVMGSSPPSEAFNTNSIGLPFMQGNADIRNGLSAPRLYTSEITKECKVDDILLSVRAPVGSIAKSIHHACIGRGLAAIRAILSNSQEYLHQWLIQFEPNWKNISQGGTFEAINSNDVSALLVSLPRQVDEQTRIADCLSSVDSLIAAQTQKLDALRSHKRGLMQQLFPAEGESVPRLRFPEFEGAGEWEEQKILNLLKKSVSPVTVDAEKIYREIGTRSHGKGIFHKQPILGSALGDKRVFFVKEVALVVNIVFAWEQSVAVTSVAEKGMIASHRFPMYIPKDNKADVNFIKYFLLTSKGKELLGIASPGGAGRNKTLGQKEFENLEILSPVEVAEQTRIADCLSSLDSLITVQTDKIAELKTFKRGLMQQLFPAMDEGEG